MEAKLIRIDVVFHKIDLEPLSGSYFGEEATINSNEINTEVHIS